MPLNKLLFAGAYGSTKHATRGLVLIPIGLVLPFKLRNSATNLLWAHILLFIQPAVGLESNFTSELALKSPRDLTYYF